MVDGDRRLRLTSCAAAVQYNDIRISSSGWRHTHNALQKPRTRQKEVRERERKSELLFKESPFACYVIRHDGGCSVSRSSFTRGEAWP